MKRLDEIEARLASITPGDWELLGGNEYISPIGITVAPDDGGVTLRDANFIAHAPEDIARLMKALEAAQSVPRSGFGDPWARGYNAALNEIHRAITEALQEER